MKRKTKRVKLFDLFIFILKEYVSLSMFQQIERRKNLHDKSEMNQQIDSLFIKWHRVNVMSLDFTMQLNATPALQL